MPTTEILIRALPNIPYIQPNDNLTEIICQALAEAELTLQAQDVLVISSKIISKAEGRFVDLRTITPRPEAIEIGQKTLKDPRFVEMVLRESVEISRIAPYVLVVRHRLGFTSANAGIDQSNTGSLDHDLVLLLPENPDESAKRLAESLGERLGITPAIVISDTHGRPFRLGNLNVAIGLYGLPALYDQRGQTDLFGRELKATITAFADQVAAAAGLVSGEADEGQPIMVVRGLQWPTDVNYGNAQTINRPPEFDLYR